LIICDLLKFLGGGPFLLQKHPYFLTNGQFTLYRSRTKKHEKNLKQICSNFILAELSFVANSYKKRVIKETEEIFFE